MERILHRLRWLAAELAVFSMVFFPLAQGQAAARTQAEKAREFIKMLGLTPNHKVTVGEFHSRFRQWYPQPFRIQMDRWAALHKDELMPTITASTVKDAGGFDQVRMLVSKDGEDATLTTGSDFMMVGGVKMASGDYWSLTSWLDNAVKTDKQFKKTADKAKSMDFSKVSIAVSRAEFKRMTPEQRAEYFVRLREVQEDLAKILPSPERKTAQIESTAQDVVARWVMGLPAFAAGPDVKAGDSCIVAGYVSQYGENKSCGGMSTGRRDFLDQIRTQFSTTFKRAQACAPQSFPCNPLVYGFNESGGAHCVAAGDMKYATSKCNDAAPINTIDERRKIVQSWVKAQGKDDVLEFNEKGRVKEDQFSLIEKQLKDMNELVAKGDAICAAENEKLKQIDNQKSACENLHIRGFQLRTFGPAPLPAPPPAPVDDCNQKVLGSHLEEGKGCVCDPGLTAADAGDGKKKCAEPVPKPDKIVKADTEEDLPLPPLPEKKERTKKDEECGFFCKNTWVIPLLVGVGVLGLMYFLFRGNNTTAQTPVYVPPVSPPGTTTPVPPVSPPPPPPPPSSKPTTGEGGTVVAPINSGGVR